VCTTTELTNRDSATFLMTTMIEVGIATHHHL
jgi:hypothetical protein